MHAAKKKESAPAEVKNQGGAKEKKPESSPSHVNPLWLQLATGFETPAESCAGDSSLCVQTKLAVGAPDDPHEREADDVAATVLRLPNIGTRKYAEDEEFIDSKSQTEITDENIQPIRRKRFPCTGNGQIEPDELPLAQKKSNPSSSLALSTNRSTSLSIPTNGSPLPDNVRSRIEPVLGTDLRQVRVHDDQSAQEKACSLNAKAFTHGNHIWLGPNQRADDLGLMAHEATHVVQQTVRVQPSVYFHPGQFIQRNDGETGVTIILSGERTGMMYPELRRVISEDQWNGLNRAAQLRRIRQRERQELEVDATERQRFVESAVPEIQVPVRSLLRPQPGTSSDYPAGLFNAMVSQPSNTFLHGSIASSEMARRWVENNSSIVEGGVTVALVDPNGLLDGPPKLTFQVEEHPIVSQDGALYILALDRAFPTIENIRRNMAEELRSMERAANLALLSTRLIQHGRRMNNIGHRGFSGDEVTSWMQALNQALQRIQRFSRDNESLSSLLQGPERNLSNYIQSHAQPFATAHEIFLRENMPEESYGEAATRRMSSCIETQNRLMTEGGFWNRLSAGQLGQSCSQMAAGYGSAMLFTGGYVEQSRQWHQAFRGGHISLDAFERGMESAATRAWIVGGITVVLTIATIGLAGPVLGTSASIGSQMLYWGSAAAATTALSMTAGSLYTSSVSMDEPYAEQIWQQGLHSPEDIFWASLLSFGIGAAIAGAGGLMSWLSRGSNTQAARALAVASSEGRALTPPAGIQAREVSRGVVEISISGQPGKIRVTPEGFRVITPAGLGEASIAEFSWQEAALAPELAQQSPIPGLRGLVAVQPQGGQPFAFGVTQEGWVVMAPRTSTPFTTGLWGEMPGAGGITSIVPYGDPTALALPSRGALPTVTSGGASPIISMGGHGIRVLPGAAPTLPGPTFIDIQAGTPFFMQSMVASTPGARGIALESGDWMIGYQGVTTINPRDLALSRTFVQSMPYWPPNISGRVVPYTDLPEFAGLGPDVYMNPSTRLFPQSGPVRVVPEAFFPPVGQQGRLLPLNQMDVIGLTTSAHPQLHGVARQIFWRRPFALQAADEPTQGAMGRELNNMLQRDGFIEFRLLRSGDRQIVHRIAAEIPNHRIVEISQTTIRRFLRDGTVPDNAEATSILRAAEQDLQGTFSPLGGGDINRIIRIYKLGE